MRKIETELVHWLDEKLKLNIIAQEAIQMKDPRTLLIEASRVCVGIREATNRNDGPMVALLQETIGRSEDEAWCMSFVQSLIAYCEVKTGVKSVIYPSEHCMTVWDNTHPDARVKYHPLPGAIAIWKYLGSRSGHTGVVLGADESIFKAVEGNTSKGTNDPRGRVIREGGGVYYTTRSKRGAGKMRVVGFLKPFPAMRR